MLGVGALVSGAMMLLPIFLAIDITHPPAGLTEWLVLVISFGGALSLIQIGMQKFFLNPAIMKALENLPTRREFDEHIEQDNKFQDRVDNFITNYYESGIDTRHHARRKGDPQ
jgi:hypothetical protein